MSFFFIMEHLNAYFFHGINMTNWGFQQLQKFPKICKWGGEGRGGGGGRGSGKGKEEEEEEEEEGEEEEEEKEEFFKVNKIKKRKFW